jgi:antitoxin MazE
LKAKLVQIGNSRGVRIPKPLIEQARLSEEVDLQVRGRSIVISSETKPRQNWASAARDLHRRGEDQLVLPAADTNFDVDEWQW